MTVTISDTNRRQLHRLAVDYQWREYARRLALRDARRAVTISDTNRRQLHRLAVDYQWREYARRLALRDARRAEVHQILGFTDAPYQIVKNAHKPTRRRPAEQIARKAGRPVAWARSHRAKPKG